MSDNNLLLGVDIGTSACKATAFDLQGNEIAVVTEPYRVYYPEENYAEQDADEWTAAAFKAIRIITDSLNGRKIIGVGIDGQSWSCILCDRNGNALCKTPIWFDRRAAIECDNIIKTIGEDSVFGVCGNPVEPTYTTPKAMWFKNNAPELYGKTYKILQSNSYIIQKLTGKFTQDISQGYGHFFFDLKRRAYNKELLDELGLNASHYSEPCEGREIVGTVTAGAAKLTGLCEGTPVIAGGLDAACGTLGTGVYEAGQTQEQSGTSGGMSICLCIPKTHKKLISCAHVVENTWLLQGGTSGGGGSMQWFFEQFGGAFDGHTLADIDKQASDVPAGSDGVVFLPYMAGERSPIWDSHAKGVFFGLSYSTGRAHMARAIMEGVAYSLRHNMDTAAETGAGASAMYPSGGASRSRIWTQIKADVTGCAFNVPKTANATNLGGAILAGVGVGVWNNFADAAADMTSVVRTHEPDASLKDVYNRGYEKYLALYRSVKDLF